MIEIIIFATLCLFVAIVTTAIFTRIIRNIFGADNEYCRIMNIDCDKSDYKTNREIELEKKLEIAVKALKCYAFADFEAEEIEHDELSPNYGVPVIKKFPYAINQELAQQTLKEIRE